MLHVLGCFIENKIIKKMSVLSIVLFDQLVFMGENLEKFIDMEGNDSIQQYLKSHGLFSSQLHLYIKTKKKQLQDSKTSDQALKKKFSWLTMKSPETLK